MELRIWFGEDLKNWSDWDNQERVCVDVYGYVIGQRGSGGGGAPGGGTSKAEALLRELKANLGNIMQKWK